MIFSVVLLHFLVILLVNEKDYLTLVRTVGRLYSELSQCVKTVTKEKRDGTQLKIEERQVEIYSQSTEGMG